MGIITPTFRNEKHFTASVRKTARQLGWLTYHTYNSQRSDPGFPDFVLLRGKKLIFAELKMPKGRLSKFQKEWGTALTKSGQQYYLWRPKDWDDILTVLQSQ